MSKRAAAASSKKLTVEKVDPVVTKVQETLEENLTYFIDNIAGLVKRYDVMLGNALKENRGTAAEIAALQAAAEAAASKEDGVASDSADIKKDGGAGGAAASSSSGKNDDDDAAKKTDAVAPIVRQASISRMPSSPLLKRAASPIVTSGSDTFPGMASARTESTTATSAAGAVAGAASSKAKADAASPLLSKKKKKNQVKARVVEVRFPDNTNLVKQLRLLKREAYELGSTMDGIHDWIALNVPDIKEDDNDNVEIMGAVIEQVTSLTDTVKAVYSAESQYIEQRSEIEKAMLKLPESETMKLSMAAGDSNAWDEVDRAWRTLVRITLLLYSILSKNMAALKEPRKAAASHAGMFM